MSYQHNDSSTAFSETDVLYMRKAIEEAQIAAEHGDVPVGAILVADDDGRILASGHNTRELLQTALGHAELNALESACAALGTRRLPPCTLYVTLEPCPMCTGAAINARIGRIVYAAKDPRAGACESLVKLPAYPLESNPVCEGGILEEEALAMLRSFFLKKRSEKKAYSYGFPLYKSKKIGYNIDTVM